MYEVDLRWGQDDPRPYLVPIPRVPVAGDHLTGPDDFGTLVVVTVEFVYESGFVFEPTRVVVKTVRADATTREAG